jgi:hypothetical protein
MAQTTVGRSRPKERRNLTVDADVAAWLDASGNASATANAALHQVMKAQAERAALAALVAELDAELGPADPDEVAHFVALMGGAR